MKSSKPRPWDLEEATDVAVKQRSDLKASTDRIDQQEKVVTQTQAQFFPGFIPRPGMIYQQNQFMLHNTQWFAIFGMNWNLFSGLDTKAQVSQAQAQGPATPGAAQGPE